MTHTQWKQVVRTLAIRLRKTTRRIGLLCGQHAHKAGMVFAVLVGFFAWLWFGMHQPPSLFPVRTIVTVPEGTSLSAIAEILQEENVVRSSWAFTLVVHASGKDAQVRAGEYYFEVPLTLSEVVDRVTRGEYGLEPLRVTVPEGATTYQMSEIFSRAFERFDPTTFSLLTKDKEGYLFPDTYFFLPNASAVDIVSTLESTFYERLRLLEEKIAQFGRPVHEVVTMASLLEKEARDFEERRIIAGVLWKRLETGMPLQVDAVFGYIEKTETFSPLFSHLETESPYNTYKYKGLPPGPIGSPSLDAIEAAVSPEVTSALFYLHGKDGLLYVADTYEEHLLNRRRYLD